MKKWVENKEPSGAVVHTLVFGHHGDDPKVIVALFRDSDVYKRQASRPMPRISGMREIWTMR